MNGYRIKVDNGLTWVSNSSFSREFMVFATDITGALVAGTEQLESLRTELAKRGATERVLTYFAISSIIKEVECANTYPGGELGHGWDGSDTETWVKTTANKIMLNR